MRVDPYTVPSPVSPTDSAFAEKRIRDRLLIAADEETDSLQRQLLEDAADLVRQLSEELQAYRNAAEYDYSRPMSMQFRGWNMGRLDQARRKTAAAGRVRVQKTGT